MVVVMILSIMLNANMMVEIVVEIPCLIGICFAMIVNAIALVI